MVEMLILNWGGAMTQHRCWWDWYILVSVGIVKSSNKYSLFLLDVFTTFTLHHHNRFGLTHHLKNHCYLWVKLYICEQTRAIYIFNRLPGGNNRLLQSGAKTTIQSPSSYSHLWICYECSKLSMTERINEASNFTLLIPHKYATKIQVTFPPAQYS